MRGRRMVFLAAIASSCNALALPGVAAATKTAFLPSCVRLAPSWKRHSRSTMCLAKIEWGEGIAEKIRRCVQDSPEALREQLCAPVDAPVQRINDPELESNGVELFLKREDQIHPYISGNKWRKLKYNALEAAAIRSKRIITFGGAFSNHISATAAMGALSGIETIGVIRGEEVDLGNPTLSYAASQGMNLIRISRQEYRQLTQADASPSLLSSIVMGLGSQGDFVIPEGGGNALGTVGCSEALSGSGEVGGCMWDAVTVSCGTGSTLAGLAAAAGENTEVVGYPALKGGSFLRDEAARFLAECLGEARGYAAIQKIRLRTDYHFGGYAKFDQELVGFMRGFYEEHGIKLDPVYTGKMLYGVYQDAREGKLRGRVLAIHTGGLQGLEGAEARLGEKIY